MNKNCDIYLYIIISYYFAITIIIKKEIAKVKKKNPTLLNGPWIEINPVFKIRAKHDVTSIKMT